MCRRKGSAVAGCVHTGRQVMQHLYLAYRVAISTFTVPQNLPAATFLLMKRFRNRYLLASDAALLGALPFFLYALRFESFTWPPEHARTSFAFSLVMVPLEIAILLGFGLYRRLWRYASVWELELIFA